MLLCAGKNFLQKSALRIQEKVLHQSDKRLFTRFYREPEVHDKEGIGIGLYLAREIITLQNGYIEVQSQIGQGSKFIIYLPNRD